MFSSVSNHCDFFIHIFQLFYLDNTNFNMMELVIELHSIISIFIIDNVTNYTLSYQCNSHKQPHFYLFCSQWFCYPILQPETFYHLNILWYHLNILWYSLLRPIVHVSCLMMNEFKVNPFIPLTETNFSSPCIEVMRLIDIPHF